MGLVAHYKLDGDANDAFGKYNGTASNVNWVDGKLGKAGSFNGSSSSVNGMPIMGLKGDRQHSMSFWLYANALSSTRQDPISLGNAVNNQYSSVDLYNTGLQWYFFNNDIKANFTVPVQQWFHVALVYKSGGGTSAIKSIYINVVKQTNITTSGTYYGSLNSLPEPANLYIGRDGGRNTAYFNGLIDDVRIYDHALSEREVRDLAKGLVLHYTFDQFQEPTENLLRKSGATPLASARDLYDRSTKTINADGSVRFVNNGTGGSTVRLYCNLADLTSGETYGVQVKFRENTGTVEFDWCDTAIGNGVVTSTQSSGLLYGTGTRATYDGTYRFLDINISSGGSVTLYEDQVEKKKYTTPFVNGTRTGVVRDQSTQGNDAPLALVNTPKWVEGGVVGKGCYEFVSNSIDCGNSFHTTKDQTISIWVKPSNFSARRNFYNRNYGGEGTITQETNGTLSYYWGTNGSDSGPYQGFSSVTGLILNQWNHVCLVRKLGVGGYLLWYINGVQTASVDPAYTEAAKSVSNLRLGTGYTAFFNGMLDDVRIYTTALSADEVKELHQQRASLDSRGNLLC